MIIDHKGLALSVLRTPMQWFFYYTVRDTLNREYYVPNLEDLEAETENYLTALNDHGARYVLDIFDCDAYAYLYKGHMILQALDNEMMRPQWPVGIAIGMANREAPVGHAYNFAYVRLPQGGAGWVYIEPQVGEIAPIEDCPYFDVRIAQI